MNTRTSYSKKKFYKNGADNQKMADISFDIRRPDISYYQDWTPEQKKEAIDFMLECRQSIEQHIKVLNKYS